MIFESFESGDTATDTFVNFSFHGGRLCHRKEKPIAKRSLGLMLDTLVKFSGCRVC